MRTNQGGDGVANLLTEHRTGPAAERDGVRSGATTPPRGSWRLLVDRDFGSFFWGKLFAASSLYLHALVASLAIFSATRSTAAVALVAVAQFAPQLALAPAAGAWSDRGRVGPQIVLGRLLCALGSGGLAAWWVLSPGLQGWAQAWVVVAASTAVGLGLVIGGPAMQSVPPLLVRRDELPTAMALNTAPMTIGRIVGPIAGAVIVEVAGFVPALAIAAAGQLVFAAAMLAVRLPARPAGTATHEHADTIAGALRHVRGDRPLLLLLLLVVCLGVGSEPVTTMAPALIAGLGGGPGAVGYLTAGFGCGALVGIVASSTMARRARHEKLAPAAVAVLALGVVGCGLAPGLLLAVAATVLAGAGFIVASSSTSTLIQLRVPAELRGRVMALWLMAFVGSRPLAAVTAGVIADLVSVTVACLIVATTLLAVVVVCRPARLT